MYNQLIDREKGEFEKSLQYLRDEITKIRTGRASSALVENLPVDYYGSRAPLKQVASVGVPEPRQIVISPWDKDNLINIEKSIRESNLNLNPINDGQVIRINIPQLNEERRKELVKLLNQKAEEARVSVRKKREELWDLIQDLTREGKISEDDKFQGKDRLQKIVDEYNGKIEEIRNKKEEEITTI